LKSVTWSQDLQLEVKRIKKLSNKESANISTQLPQRVLNAIIETSSTKSRIEVTGNWY
jgi:hypothetical protein